MSSKKPKATRRRMISCFAQIVQEHIPGWRIEEIASGEKVKARRFSSIFRNEEPDFTRGRHHGRLTRFRLRNIYAIDSTTIQLAFCCIDWAKHRQKKAAVKVHMVANVANRMPHFCVFGKAKDHDSRKEDELFGSLKAGDIGIADRAYNHFKALHRQTTRGVFFVVLVRAIVWLKKDAMAILRSYGIAPPPDPGGIASGMPYLPGFEKMFLKSAG